MSTTQSQPRSWYDSPFGRLCEGAGHRHPKPTVAEVMAHLAGRTR